MPVLRNEAYGRKSMELVGETCVKKWFLLKCNFSVKIKIDVEALKPLFYLRSGGIDF